ncbi:MAG: tetratricopeptide repeat protein [Planctomycetota bacterium]
MRYKFDLLAGDMIMLYVVVVAAAFLIPASIRLAGWTEAVAWMVSEDSIYEVAGAAFCLVGGIVFLAGGVQRRLASGRAANPLQATWCMLFGLGILVLFLEEISWGQRLIGIASTATMQRLNAQGELTLHNLRIFQDGYSFNWLYLVLLGGISLYLMLTPLLSHYVPPFGRFLDRLQVPKPTGGMAWGTATSLSFLIAAEPLRHGLNWLTVQGSSEIFETVIEGILCSLAIHSYRGIPAEVRCLSPRWLIATAGSLAVPFLILAIYQLKDVTIESRAFEQASIFVAAGHQELTKGDLQAAEKRFADALLIHNHHPDTVALIALTYAQAGHAERAHGVLDRGLHRNPNAARLHAGRGLVLAITGKAEEAVQHFEHAVRLDPTDHHSRENLEKLRAAFGAPPTK